MTTLNKVLAGVLVAQLLATALTWRPRSGGSDEAADLLGFPTDQVTKISVTGRMAREEVPEDPVVLAKQGDGWVIETSDGYPAQQSSVQPLLDNLAELHAVRDPIARRAEDHALLEVADDRFTRKVDVTAADGTTRTLYFGAAKGQNAHVRAAGDEEVYDVRGFSAWSLAETDNRYFDRELLKVDPTVVQSMTIERPGEAPVRFVQADGQWTVEPKPEGLEVDPSTTRTFVQSALTVRMLEPAGKEVTPEMGLDQGAKVSWVELDPDGGAPTNHSYVIGSPIPDENGRLWMKSTTSPWVVKVLKGTVLHAIEKPFDPLFVDPNAPPKPAPAAPSGPPPGHGRVPGH